MNGEELKHRRTPQRKGFRKSSARTYVVLPRPVTTRRTRLGGEKPGVCGTASNCAGSFSETRKEMRTVVAITHKRRVNAKGAGAGTSEVVKGRW